MNPIYLREYESTDSLPIPREEVLNIRKRLQSSKGGSQLAEVIYDLDGVKLRALAQVGYIPVRDDLQLVVMPKIKNFDDFFYVIERARLIPSFFLDESIFAALGESERN